MENQTNMTKKKVTKRFDSLLHDIKSKDSTFDENSVITFFNEVTELLLNKNECFTGVKLPVGTLSIKKFNQKNIVLPTGDTQCLRQTIKYSLSGEKRII